MIVLGFFRFSLFHHTPKSIFQTYACDSLQASMPQRFHDCLRQRIGCGDGDSNLTCAACATQPASARSGLSVRAGQDQKINFRMPVTTSRPMMKMIRMAQPRILSMMSSFNGVFGGAADVR